jgi:glycosyltransferase involved in cell wall biosynthesis
VPAVSCILATGGRPRFLRQAIRCFRAQSLTDAELVVVDDGPEPDRELPSLDERIRYVWLDHRASLGRKLNVAAVLARGELLQKLDDDDYYHPHFLASTVEALRGQGTDTVAACGTFLVLLARSGEVRHAGRGWFAGATLCFPRRLWERRPFRDVTRGEDWFFLEDHGPRRLRLSRPELFIAVRHGAGHTWTRSGRRPVDEVFRRRPRYRVPLERLVPPEALAFYRSLRDDAPSAGTGMGPGGRHGPGGGPGPDPDAM